MNANWVVVCKIDGRKRAYGYPRHKGPPATFLTVGAKAARMSEAEARALAAKLAAEFPSWGWVAMPKADF